MEKRLDNQELVFNWHRKIVNICEDRLGRQLTDIEKRFIESRGGFMALEMIEDTVNTTASIKDLEGYLNSEA